MVLLENSSFLQYDAVSLLLGVLKALCQSEMVRNTHNNILEDLNPQQSHCGNLKSCMVLILGVAEIVN